MTLTPVSDSNRVFLLNDRFILIAVTCCTCLNGMVSSVSSSTVRIPARQPGVALEPFTRVNETEMANFMRLSHLTKYFFPGPLSIFRPAYRLPSQFLTDMMPVTNFSQFGRATRVELTKFKDSPSTSSPAPTTKQAEVEEESKPEVSVIHPPFSKTGIAESEKSKPAVEIVTLLPSIETPIVESEQPKPKVEEVTLIPSIETPVVESEQPKSKIEEVTLKPSIEIPVVESEQPKPKVEEGSLIPSVKTPNVESEQPKLKVEEVTLIPSIETPNVESEKSKPKVEEVTLIPSIVTPNVESEQPKSKIHEVTLIPSIETPNVESEKSKPKVEEATLKPHEAENSKVVETIPITPRNNEPTENIPFPKRPEDETNAKVEVLTPPTPKQEESGPTEEQPSRNFKVVTLTPLKSLQIEKEIKPLKKIIENHKKESKIIRLLTLKFVSNAKPIGVVINGQTKDPKGQTATSETIRP